MGGREYYSLRIKCRSCGRTGTARFSEHENPVYARGDLNRVTEEVSEHFKIAGTGPEHIKCECGSEDVVQDQ